MDDNKNNPQPIGDAGRAIYRKDKVIDKKTVEYIANLSKIKLSEEEKERLIPELNDILFFADELKRIPADEQGGEYPPLMSVLDIALPKVELSAELPMMDDKVDEKNNAPALLKIAPAMKEMGSDEDAGGFFVVPKVVGGE